MSFLTFPVSGNYQSLAPGGIIRGTVRFMPNVLPGIPAHGVTGGVTYGMLPEAVFGIIDNGVLRPSSSFATSVTLTSNDPTLNLTGQLQYTADFIQVTVDGYPITVNPVTFDAPDDSTPVDLVEVSPGTALQIISGLPSLPVSGLSDAPAYAKAFLLAADSQADALTYLGISGSTGVLPFANLASFPATGAANTLYYAEDTHLLYIWDGGSYVLTGSSAGVTTVNGRGGAVTLTADDTPDGTTNKAYSASDKTRLANTSGTNTGDQTSVTGNAGTATKLATARNINGVAFDGSANITVADSTKEPAITGTTSADYWRGDKTFQNFNTAVRANRLDQMAAPTAAINANSQKISSLADPVSPQDAATKMYVDATIQGLQQKPDADVAATSALPAGTYSNGSSGVGATFTVTATGTTTVDGHVLALNDNVLLTAQASDFQNGLYVVTTAGTTGVSTVLTRHTSMDVATEFPGAFVAVRNIGTSNKNSLWLANPSGAVTVGTTSIPFTQLNSATSLSQGAGITISGGTVSIENSGVLLPAHGGTGAGTLTGIVKGNGTSAFTAAAAGTDYVAPGGALGTPSSGTLTNCTFPTLNQSTTGNAATATKLATARAINGVNFDGSAAITLIPRVNTTASSATPAINTDTTDVFTITALAAAITSMTSGLSGTPVNNQRLLIRIKDNGTARAITWGSSFVSSGIATLLATTVANKTHLIGFMYDSAAAVWVCVAVDSAGY